MSALGATADSVKSSRCPICCEPINPAAKRCNACGTRLDRSDLMHRFSSASTVLAVLTALISVITVGLPSLVHALKPDSSKVHLAFVRRGNDYPAPYTFDFQIYVSNSGTRPGAFGSVWVSSAGSGDRIELEIPEHYWPKDTAAIRNLEILPPGESRNLYFSRRQPDVKLPDKATVNIEVIEFDGTVKQHALSIPPDRKAISSQGR